MTTFGDEQWPLTHALRALACDSANVDLKHPHVRQEMEKDDFDDTDVLECLRKGTAFGLEPRGPRQDLRTNVVHRNLNIRVTVGGLREANDAGNWTLLRRIKVVTVMRIK